MQRVKDSVLLLDVSWLLVTVCLSIHCVLWEGAGEAGTSKRAVNPLNGIHGLVDWHGVRVKTTRDQLVKVLSSSAKVSVTSPGLGTGGCPRSVPCGAFREDLPLQGSGSGGTGRPTLVNRHLWKLSLSSFSLKTGFFLAETVQCDWGGSMWCPGMPG